MFELTSADRSLLFWIQQVGVRAQELSIRFVHGNLIVQCQSVEDATKLWEMRSLLQMPGKELCFEVDGNFYVGAML